MESGYKILWTDHALWELTHTYEYLELHFSETELQKLTEEIDQTLRLIVTNPALFPISDSKGIRKAVTSYLKYPSPYMTWKYMFHNISLFSDQLIYRVVKLPMTNPELKDRVDELNTIWDRASIMVLDPDPNLLREYLFPSSSNYSWSEFFCWP